ncbi:hypothetical protein GALMADRAFT_1359434 [Galerina marginata CBS 339.88]|uniref:Uncharacterized protein n=1 Tax=Galerina marginata (strain CBS 339.88) TaxID=685588 RepID=A0A067S726_GALM3|nr:hypothetical protein GALMADRAFT_1359434 [Galerina marginata CBS 339.88]
MFPADESLRPASPIKFVSVLEVPKKRSAGGGGGALGLGWADAGRGLRVARMEAVVEGRARMRVASVYDAHAHAPAARADEDGPGTHEDVVPDDKGTKKKTNGMKRITRTATSSEGAAASPWAGVLVQEGLEGGLSFLACLRPLLDLSRFLRRILSLCLRYPHTPKPTAGQRPANPHELLHPRPALHGPGTGGGILSFLVRPRPARAGRTARVLPVLGLATNSNGNAMNGLAGLAGAIHLAEALVGPFPLPLRDPEEKRGGQQQQQRQLRIPTHLTLTTLPRHDLALLCTGNDESFVVDGRVPDPQVPLLRALARGQGQGWARLCKTREISFTFHAHNLFFVLRDPNPTHRLPLSSLLSLRDASHLANSLRSKASYRSGPSSMSSRARSKTSSHRPSEREREHKRSASARGSSASTAKDPRRQPQEDEKRERKREKESQRRRRRDQEEKELEYLRRRDDIGISFGKSKKDKEKGKEKKGERTRDKGKEKEKERGTSSRRDKKRDQGKPRGEVDADEQEREREKKKEKEREREREREWERDRQHQQGSEHERDKEKESTPERAYLHPVVARGGGSCGYGDRAKFKSTRPLERDELELKEKAERFGGQACSATATAPPPVVNELDPHSLRSVGSEESGLSIHHGQPVNPPPRKASLSALVGLGKLGTAPSISMSSPATPSVAIRSGATAAAASSSTMVPTSTLKFIGGLFGKSCGGGGASDKDGPVDEEERKREEKERKAREKESKAFEKEREKEKKALEKAKKREETGEDYGVGSGLSWKLGKRFTRTARSSVPQHQEDGQSNFRSTSILTSETAAHACPEPPHRRRPIRRLFLHRQTKINAIPHNGHCSSGRAGPNLSRRVSRSPTLPPGLAQDEPQSNSNSSSLSLSSPVFAHSTDSGESRDEFDDKGRGLVLGEGGGKLRSRRAERGGRRYGGYQRHPHRTGEEGEGEKERGGGKGLRRMRKWRGGRGRQLLLISVRRGGGMSQRRRVRWIGTKNTPRGSSTRRNIDATSGKERGKGEKINVANGSYLTWAMTAYPTGFPSIFFAASNLNVRALFNYGTANTIIDGDDPFPIAARIALNPNNPTAAYPNSPIQTAFRSSTTLPVSSSNSLAANSNSKVPARTPGPDAEDEDYGSSMAHRDRAACTAARDARGGEASGSCTNGRRTEFEWVGERRKKMDLRVDARQAGWNLEDRGVGEEVEGAGADGEGKVAGEDWSVLGLEEQRRMSQVSYVSTINAVRMNVAASACSFNETHEPSPSLPSTPLDAPEEWVDARETPPFADHEHEQDHDGNHDSAGGYVNDDYDPKPGRVGPGHGFGYGVIAGRWG